MTQVSGINAFSRFGSNLYKTNICLLSIDCILVLLIGEVFVTLSDDASANQALRKHNQHIGSRYIEVYHATQEEFCLKYNLSQGVKMLSFLFLVFFHFFALLKFITSIPFVSYNI